MLTIYEFHAGELKPRTGKSAGKAAITEEAVWIDLLDPTPEEESKVEKALKLDVPTREEQQEIEASSRLYQEDGALFMTASVITQSDQAETKMTPVTFILAGNRLVTVRYAEPRAFAIYAARCNRAEPDLKSGVNVLIGLIETIVDRLADFIERIQADVDVLSHTVFDIKGGAATRQRRFDVVLKVDRARGRDVRRRRAKARTRSGACSPSSPMPPRSAKSARRCSRASAPPRAT